MSSRIGGLNLSWEVICMTISQCEGNLVPSPINSRVVAPKLQFPDNQVPASKFSNIESEVL